MSIVMHKARLKRERMEETPVWKGIEKMKEVTECIGRHRSTH